MLALFRLSDLRYSHFLKSLKKERVGERKKIRGNFPRPLDWGISDCLTFEERPTKRRPAGRSVGRSVEKDLRVVEKQLSRVKGTQSFFYTFDRSLEFFSSSIQLPPFRKVFILLFYRLICYKVIKRTELQNLLSPFWSITVNSTVNFRKRSILYLIPQGSSPLSDTSPFLWRNLNHLDVLLFFKWHWSLILRTVLMTISWSHPGFYDIKSKQSFTLYFMGWTIPF